MTLDLAYVADLDSAQHDSDPPVWPQEATRRTCAQCQKPLRFTKAGRVRVNGRFCSSKCKAAQTRERRAAARQDLLAAVAEINRLQARVQNALRVLGLLPMRPA
jgi:RNase P subunit RPR2